MIQQDLEAHEGLSLFGPDLPIKNEAIHIGPLPLLAQEHFALGVSRPWAVVDDDELRQVLTHCLPSGFGYCGRGNEA